MLVNRAKMTTATTGTGTITLGSAVDGYQTFAAAGVTDAAVVSYAIEDGTAWEIGTGTYTASGTTLSRTVSESSNAGAAINLSGNAVVFVTARAEDLATGGGAPTLATSSGASQSVDFSTSNKIHVATIDEDATLTFTNPASVAKVDLILDVALLGYTLAQASYDSVSFSVSSQSTAPLGVAFSSNGTKMYVVGSGSVFQYSLSTAWDVSTASYDSVSFSVSSQDAGAQGLTFKSDGTKMYAMGFTSGSVFQYSLSTAWDLSTASYDSVSFSVSSQETQPREVAFKSDGTKMYVVGTATDSVFQYSLSTAWDLSTASYDSISFSVNSQEALVQSLAFNNVGTKMYVSGTSADSVFQYSLSTAWDLSTASYDSVSFSVSSQENASTGMTFKSDGTKMYVIGTNLDTVFQYSTASTPSATLPAALESPTIPLAGGEKTALTIVTYDGGTTYQAINVQGGIV